MANRPVASFFAAFACHCCVAQCPRFEVVTVVEGPECSETTAGIAPRSVSNSGSLIVGSVQCPSGNARPFVWSVEGELLVLTSFPPGSVHVRAGDVNDAGLVVGHGQIPGGGASTRGWRYDARSQELAILNTGQVTTQVEAVNCAGVAVGWSSTTHAFMWVGDRVTLLGGFPPESLDSRALDISDSGHIVGYYRVPGQHIGFILHERVLTSIATPFGASLNTAQSVNSVGEVAGHARLVDDVGPISLSYYWLDGTMRPIEPLPPFRTSVAQHISESGDVVGELKDAVGSGASRAFYWSKATGRTHLITDLIEPPLACPAKNPVGFSNSGELAVNTTEVGLFYVLAPIDPVAGDVTCDGSVDFGDIVVLLSNWGPCAPCEADLNHDETVDALDLEIVLSGWVF